MMKTSQLSPLAFALYKTYCPAGISAVAGLTQQQVQQSANLWFDVSLFKDFPFLYLKSSLHRSTFPWGLFPWNVNRINDLEVFNNVRQ